MFSWWPPGEATGGGAGLPSSEGGATLAAQLAKEVQGGCVEATKEAGDKEHGKQGGDGGGRPRAGEVLCPCQQSCCHVQGEGQ